MKKGINTFAKNREQVSLIINIYETNCIVTNKYNVPFKITSYRKLIQQVNEFVYLSHNLSSLNESSVSVRQWIDIGWTALEKNSFLNSCRIPHKPRFKTRILPILLYSLDYVKWTITLVKLVETFQKLRHLIDDQFLTTISNKDTDPSGHN